MSESSAALSPRTALLRAVASDDPAAVEGELQHRGLSLDHRLDEGGNSLLHVSVTYGAGSALGWLLAARADVNICDAGGLAPLHMASIDGSADAVKALLAAAADPHLTSKDRLVRLGRMPMYVCGGRTPLHLARTPEVVHLLLAAAADPDTRDLDGNTPWDVALREESKPRVELAAAINPKAVIPEAAAIDEARRADFKARSARITMQDVCSRLEQEESEEELDPAVSDEEGEVITHEMSAEGALRNKLKEAGKDEGFAGKQWEFADPEGLTIDSGPNQHRLLKDAHLWRASASDLAEAVLPFAATPALCSPAALRAVLGGIQPPLQPPEGAYGWCYCGHQLGSFSGQLGDGAALNARLGSDWELCWKGIGHTPFSRPGTNGRKRVGSCVRELLLSETLAALGVPCQRGLAMFASEGSALGTPPSGTPEEADTKSRDPSWALLVRACPGNLGMVRLGTFDLANGPAMDPRSKRAGPSPGNAELVARLVALGGEGAGEEAARKLLSHACARNAALCASWAALGFVHGMLNTDNLHVSGVAIDLAGACFMGGFDRDYDADGPSAAKGRYSYRRQPAAVLWALRRLATALAEGGQLLPKEVANATVAQFPCLYRQAWLCEMRQKLGLPSSSGKQQDREDRRLLRGLFKAMEATHSDFTTCFLCLAPPAPSSGRALLERLTAHGMPVPDADARAEQLRRRAARTRPAESQELLEQIGSAQAHEGGREGEAGTEAARRLSMKVSQRLGLHAHADLLEQSAKAATGKSVVELQAEDAGVWDAWLEAYAQRCSTFGGADGAMMAKANPTFVPQPWAVDEAAAAAEKGDFGPARQLLERLQGHSGCGGYSAEASMAHDYGRKAKA